MPPRRQKCGGPQRAALIVHDDCVFRTRLAALLSRLGIETSTSDGLDACLTLAAELQPAYVVTEMRPVDRGDVPGPRALQAIRRSVPDCCIVVVTRYQSLAGCKAASALGVADYLAQPVELHRVLAALGIAAPPQIGESPAPRHWTLARHADEVIHQTLLDTNGNISATARRLGMTRRGLQRRLDKHIAAPEGASQQPRTTRRHH